MSNGLPRDPALPPEAWSVAHNAARRLVSPIQRILLIEAGSGLLLLAATIAALVAANTVWHEQFHHFWETPIGLQVGSWEVSRSLHFVVNDGLMTIFFFVVGLEIRREMHEGELSRIRTASLPIAAALGGMLIPAAIYAAFNRSGPGAAGWAIPMATDIAFAVGALTVLGKRVPPALRVLLLALAVIDDIGAIIVIAIFYSGGIQLAWVGAAIGACGGVFVLRAAGIRSPWAYVVPAILLWIAMYRAGIHPTLAGVALGLMTPASPWYGTARFAEHVRDRAAAVPNAQSEHEVAGYLEEIGRARREALSPAVYLQHKLHPWVAFAIMPLFALANAGVELGGASLSGDAWWVFLGIVLGLLLGKPIGVFAASRIAIATRLSIRPRDVTYVGVGIVGIVAGIGFTMSLFIAQLAFPPGPLLATAKLAILAGSAASLLAGALIGRLALKKPAIEPASLTEAEQNPDL